MSDDYKIIVTVKNNYLLEMMKLHGLHTAAALSRHAGVEQSAIGCCLNLSTSMRTSRGVVRSFVIKIADSLKCLPEDIFPPAHHYESLETNKAETTLNAEDYTQYLGSLEQPSLEHDVIEAEYELSKEELLVKMISSPPLRESEVIKMRFGLTPYTRKYTLEEVGKKLDICGQRVRQIEKKALSRLRHPKINENFDFFENIA